MSAAVGPSATFDDVRPCAATDGRADIYPPTSPINPQQNQIQPATAPPRFCCGLNAQNPLNTGFPQSRMRNARSTVDSIRLYSPIHSPCEAWGSVTPTASTARFARPGPSAPAGLRSLPGAFIPRLGTTLPVTNQNTPAASIARCARCDGPAPSLAFRASTQCRRVQRGISQYSLN